jgi:hypothetical protein
MDRRRWFDMFEGDFYRFEDCGENWIKKETIKNQEPR